MTDLRSSTASEISPALLTYYRRALADRTWQLRRVESVTFLGLDTLERRSSIDIDVYRLAQIAAESGMGTVAQVPIPIGFDSKGLHLKLDLTSGNEDAEQLLPSGVDAVASYALIEQWLDNCPFAAHPSMPDVKQRVFETACSHFTDDDAMELEEFLNGGSDWLSIWGIDGNDLLLSGLFRVLLGDLTFLDLLFDITLRCRPLVLVDSSQPLVTIKIRKIEPSEPPFAGLRSNASGFLRLSPVPIKIEDTALGQGISTHLHLAAPSGTYFEDVRVRGWEALPYQRVVTRERVVLHASSRVEVFEFDQREIELDLWPTAESFVVPSLITCWVSWLLLVAAQLNRQYVEKFSADQPEVVFGAILALPTIYVYFLSRTNEHDVRSYMLRGVRRLLWATAASHTVVMSSLMIEGTFPWMVDYALWVSILVTTCSGTILTFSWYRSRQPWGVDGHAALGFPESVMTIAERNEVFNLEDLY